MRKRQTPFVQIDSKSVNNEDLSLRSIGLLAWLLDKPEGWDVRSEAIAKKTKEGRGAIRTALHELAAVGHYRIERRRLLNGKFEMGTAVSYYPDPEWAAQYAEFDGKPVTMIEQPDGSFKVKHKDGTLADDGFQDDLIAPADGPESDVSAGQTEDRFSVAGFPDAGEPASGDPESGEPASGRPSPINRTQTEDTHTETDTSTSDVSAAGSDQPALDGMPDGASSTPTIGKPGEHLGDPVARWWWEQLDPKPITTSKNERPFLHIQRICRGAIDLGWSQKQIHDALLAIGKPKPTGTELDQRLRQIRDGVVPFRRNTGPAVHREAEDSPGAIRRRQKFGQS